MKRILIPALILFTMCIAGPAAAAPRAAQTTSVTARVGAVTVTKTTTTTRSAPVRVNERPRVQPAPRVVQRPAPRVVIVKRDDCAHHDRGHDRRDDRRRDDRRHDHRHDHR
jgi:hypothetical protein